MMNSMEPARPFPALSPFVLRAALSEALAKAEVATLAVQGPKVPPEKRAGCAGIPVILDVASMGPNS